MKARREKRTRVVNKYREHYDVDITRSGPYGNPYRIGVHGTRTQVIERFRKYLAARPRLVERVRRELKGNVLGCCCAPLACHGDVYVELCDEG